MKSLPVAAETFMRTSPNYRYLVSEPDENTVIVYRLVSGPRVSPPNKKPHTFYDGAFYEIQSRPFKRDAVEQTRDVNL